MSTGTIIHLSPKCYFGLNDETQEAKLGSKGVPRRAKLELNSYLARLYNSTDHPINIRSLRMINNRMARTTEKRENALNDLFLKNFVHDDRVTCSPLCQDGIVL